MTTYEYWIATDDDLQPDYFYRYADGQVEVWHSGNWQLTMLTRAEMSGLGGSADFQIIDKADEARAIEEFSVTLDHGNP